MSKKTKTKNASATKEIKNLKAENNLMQNTEKMEIHKNNLRMQKEDRYRKDTEFPRVWRTLCIGY